MAARWQSPLRKGGFKGWWGFRDGVTVAEGAGGEGLTVVGSAAGGVGLGLDLTPYASSPRVQQAESVVRSGDRSS